MKIYDKKMFWGSIVNFIAFLILTIIINILNPDKVLFDGSFYFILVLLTIRQIYISMSEKKSQEEQKRGQLYQTARYNLYGKKSKFLIWGYIALLALFFISLKYGFFVSITVFTLLTIYSLYFCIAIAKEVNRIRTNMEE